MNIYGRMYLQIGIDIYNGPEIAVPVSDCALYMLSGGVSCYNFITVELWIYSLVIAYTGTIRLG